jgi:acyl-CoA synthetase (AMP-forming)/AMP-acid ligase II
LTKRSGRNASVSRPRRPSVFDVAGALRLIAAERVTNLYLVPTLYHDLVHHPERCRPPTSRNG